MTPTSSALSLSLPVQAVIITCMDSRQGCHAGVGRLLRDSRFWPALAQCCAARTLLTCPTQLPTARAPSRLFPERMLGLSFGDAEIIRNGGGRVTEDVIRSVFPALLAAV